jgi:RNA polymerase sigma-70 factor (ECF subfamily)
MATDADLLRGDARRFAAFYRRHEDAVLRFFLRRVGSAELAADLIAETFARALEGRRRFDPRRGDAGAWLFGIARNVLLRSLERGRVENDVRVSRGLRTLRAELGGEE